MAVSKRLRFEVLRRDGYACRYCGAKAPDVALTVDHVVPETLGGSDDPSNLVAACEDCNAGKSSIQPDAELVADVAEDALRWARAIAKANDMADRERAERVEFAATFEQQWNGWTWTDKLGKPHTVGLPGAWDLRLGELLAAGLTVADMREAVDLAMGSRYVKDEFAYFVAVARQKITARQAVAAQLIREGLVD